MGTPPVAPILPVLITPGQATLPISTTATPAAGTTNHYSTAEAAAASLLPQPPYSRSCKPFSFAELTTVTIITSLAMSTVASTVTVKALA